MPGFKLLAGALALVVVCAAGAQSADSPPPNEQNSQNLQGPRNSESPPDAQGEGNSRNPQAQPDAPDPAKPPRQRFSGATELVARDAACRATA